MKRLSIGERVFVLSGKFKDNFAVVDIMTEDGRVVVCRGGEWDLIGASECVPENIGGKE